MSEDRRSPRGRGLLVRALRRLATTLMLVFMGIARAFGTQVRIEEPEPRNKVTQVEKKR